MVLKLQWQGLEAESLMIHICVIGC